jgi:hypothetical protein
MGRVSVVMALVATVLVGCGHTESHAERAHKLTSKFANSTLACVASQAPENTRFGPIAAGPNRVTEQLVILWPNGESLDTLAPRGGIAVAENGLRRLRAEWAKRFPETKPPERHGAVITVWSKAPNPEQEAVLLRCTSPPRR